MNRNELIERHLPLARALAARYRRGPEPFDDLVQVASIGLVKAAERWDPARGYAFSSYAVPTILGELRRYFRDATWDVRPPRRLQETSLVLERARNALRTRDGREPTAAMLADHLGRPVHELVEGLQAIECRKLPSLDAPARVIGDEAVTFGDTVAGEEPGYARVEAEDAFDRLIARVDTSARAMLRLRFEHDLPQREIGAQLGCSQMSVSRTIRLALERLSHTAELPAVA
jgi:RNA polymerase sigma-B factor